MQRCAIPAAAQASVNGWRRTALVGAVFGAPVVPVREGRIVVGLDLPDAKWERAAEGSQEREPRAVRELREEAHDPQPGTVIQGRVLEDLPPLDPIGHILDVHLDAIPWPGQDVALPVLRAAAVPGEQPGPLQDPVDAVDARDVRDALPAEVPGQAAGAVPGPPPPAPEPPGHPGPDLARVPVGAPGAIREAQAVPPTRGVAAPPLVVGLPGDPEEDTGVGDGPERLGLAKPVQPLPNALFPDNVGHG